MLPVCGDRGACLCCLRVWWRVGYLVYDAFCAKNTMEESDEEREIEVTSKEKHTQVLLWRIRSLYETHEFSDIKLVVQDKIFPCHRLILSTFSPYFDAMFSSGMMESSQTSITLPFLDANQMDLILQVMYLGDNIVTLENAVDLLPIASFLQMDYLKDACEEVLCSKAAISVEKFFTFLSVAKSHNCQRLIKSLLRFLTDSFKDLVLAEEFCHLDYEDLLKIIQNDLVSLNVRSEETVSNSVMRWINSDKDNRSKFAKNLYEFVKLPLTSMEHLEKLRNEECIKNSPECQNFIQEALSYIRQPACQNRFSSSRTEERGTSNALDILMINGPYKDTYGFSTKCKGSKLKVLAGKPCSGRGFALCCYDNHTLFMCGGVESPMEMVKYDGLSNKWSNCCLLPERRAFHGMIAIDEDIFVLGGWNTIESFAHPSQLEIYSTDSVLKYNVLIGTWSLAGKLHHHTESMGVTSQGSTIFLFGGHTFGRDQTGRVIIPHSLVQCFDTITQTSYELCPLPLDPARDDFRLIVTTIDNAIYLCYEGIGNIYQFDIQSKNLALIGTVSLETEEEEEVELIDENYILDMCHYNGNLILFVVGKKLKILEFDVNQQQWKKGLFFGATLPDSSMGLYNYIRLTKIKVASCNIEDYQISVEAYY